MTYQEVLENARKLLYPKCKVCPVCNGRACAGQVPGVGGIGSGRAFTVCREYLDSISIPLDPVHEHWEADPSIELFGRKFSYPFFIAPIGGMPFNYTGALTEEEYCRATVMGALESGILAFTGDGPLDDYFPSTLPVIREAGGTAVSTIKPWGDVKIKGRIEDLEETGVLAIAMDLDSAALRNLRLKGKPAYTKSVEELKSIISFTGKPFLIKGVMTAKAALKCAQAGAYGIVISSHGGRILEDTPAPAAMITEIRQAVGSHLKIFVDGGIRSGGDVFKCLALGADAVLIGRPYAIAAYGGRQEGVKLYTERIAGQLKDVMMMTDCRDLKDIDAGKIRCSASGTN